MKNLDIEKLERKNIYQAPEDFFEEMQAKVFKEITTVKKARIISMNWAYSAAAAIAIIFGVTFFVNSNGVEENVQNPIANVESSSPSGEVSADRSQISNNDLEEAGTINLEDKRQQVVEERKIAAQPMAVVTPKTEKYIPESKKVSRGKAEIPMDQIISSFTSADLADLSRNTEQDIYLDLYN